MNSGLKLILKGAAGRGKMSMGWFYGFKLHLVINHLGEIVTFTLTSGNKADNNQNLLHELLQGLEGLCFGNKGYLTAIWNELYAQGVKLVTRLKKNMKNKLTLPYELYLLCKRSVIESVNNIFKQCLDLEHTRHRKPENGIAHMLCSVIAYHFYENKPCIRLPHIGRKLRS